MDRWSGVGWLGRVLFVDVLVGFALVNHTLVVGCLVVTTLMSLTVRFGSCLLVGSLDKSKDATYCWVFCILSFVRVHSRNDLRSTHIWYGGGIVHWSFRRWCYRPLHGALYRLQITIYRCRAIALIFRCRWIFLHVFPGIHIGISEVDLGLGGFPWRFRACQPPGLWTDSEGYDSAIWSLIERTYFGWLLHCTGRMFLPESDPWGIASECAGRCWRRWAGTELVVQMYALFDGRTDVPPIRNGERGHISSALDRFVVFDALPPLYRHGTGSHLLLS